MVRSRLRRTAFSLVLAVGLAVGAVAGAAGDDRAVTETLLREVASAQEKDVANELVTRARTALERGARMRSAGDEAHARLADKLARTWAEGARDVTRAAAIEARSASSRRDATDAGLNAERERAILEEAIAQSGRLRAQLEAGDSSMKEPAKTSAQANLDAGTRAAPTTKPASARGDGGLR